MKKSDLNEDKMVILKFGGVNTLDQGFIPVANIPFKKSVKEDHRVPYISGPVRHQEKLRKTLLSRFILPTKINKKIKLERSIVGRDTINH